MAATRVTPEQAWANLRQDWCGFYAKEWLELVAQRRQQLEEYAASQQGETATLVVLVADAEPLTFLAGFWAGVLAGWTVALANSSWTRLEWRSAHQLTSPRIVWGSALPTPSSSVLSSSIPASSVPISNIPASSIPALSVPVPGGPLPAILIPTSGTSGQPKFVHHTWTTLTAAVAGFQAHFQPDGGPISACCVLPLYHVSGLMQALRAWLTGGQLFITSFKTLTSAPFFTFPQRSGNATCSPTFLSLVPTQLSRLIAAGRAPWLSQFQAILLGGAPPWPALLDQVAKHQIPVCLSYGMTETGAMVSAMQPQELSSRSRQGPAQAPAKDLCASLIQDNLSSGRPMPHATIWIEKGGKRSPAGEVGQVVVTSDAIAHGYRNVPSQGFKGRTLYTDDLGYLDDRGQLHITGRANSKIISGGENIFPDEVESALRSTGQVLSVCVVGLPDAEWGEAVTAAYVPAHSHVSSDRLKAALDAGGQLSRYKYPKRWFALDALPETTQGKVNRSALQALLSRLASQSVDCQ